MFIRDIVVANLVIYLQVLIFSFNKHQLSLNDDSFANKNTVKDYTQ